MQTASSSSFLISIGVTILFTVLLVFVARQITASSDNQLNTLLVPVKTYSKKRQLVILGAVLAGTFAILCGLSWFGNKYHMGAVSGNQVSLENFLMHYGKVTGSIVASYIAVIAPVIETLLMYFLAKVGVTVYLWLRYRKDEQARLSSSKKTARLVFVFCFVMALAGPHFMQGANLVAVASYLLDAVAISLPIFYAIGKWRIGMMIGIHVVLNVVALVGFLLFT